MHVLRHLLHTRVRIGARAAHSITTDTPATRGRRRTLTPVLASGMLLLVAAGPVMAQSAPVPGTAIGGISVPAMPTITVPLPNVPTTASAPAAASALVIRSSAARVEVATAATQPPSLPREFRAVWVSSVETPDWPSAAGLSAAEQQDEMRALLDRVKATGLNAIILHVRMGGDAMYATPLAPWSMMLTGRSGGDPGYDPLAFAIREAHARGIAVHAWFNPFRAVAPGEHGPFAPNHITRTHPSWIRHYGTQTWIDPGIPEARDTVLETILDVVRRYDIDGVHLDDYFYPYRESVRDSYRVPERTSSGRIRRKHGKIVYRTVYREHEIDFPDDATFRQYGAGWADRVAWRRQNIDAFVSDLYTAVHRIKPALPVGISPFGIWRSGAADGVTGLDAFTEIAADSRLWLMRGWVDYLAPQLYWPLDGVQQRFVVLEKWWREQNPQGRHIWPGLLASSSWGAQETVDEVNEIRSAREGRADSPGHIHFRYAALERDDGLASALRAGPYAQSALVPAMPWLERGMPPAPPSVTPKRDGVALAAGDSTPVAWYLVQWTDADAPAAMATWQNRLVHGDVTDVTWSMLLHHGAPKRVAISAIDRAGMQGATVIVTQTPAPDVVPFPAPADTTTAGAVSR